MQTDTSSSHLAVLIDAPHNGEISMNHDLNLMYDALSQRGLTPAQILRLEGSLGRTLVMTFLASVRDRIREQSIQRFFLHVSGHGYFTGEAAENAEVGVLLQGVAPTNTGSVSWTELFNVLALPAAVETIVLPDH